MHAQTAMIENGFVRVPDKAPWLAQYLDEMTVFPNGRQTRRHPASRFPLAHRRLLQQHRYQPRAVRMKLCVARVPLDVDHLPRRPVTPPLERAAATYKRMMSDKARSRICRHETRAIACRYGIPYIAARRPL